VGHTVDAGGHSPTRERPSGVDWDAYQKCRICRAESGKPCRAMYTRVLEGEHTGPPVELEQPHGHRRGRSGR
jgi:hypothetical protein